MRIAPLTIAFALVLISLATRSGPGRPAFSQGKCHQTRRKHDTSGLQYKVLKEGTGKSPKATDVVVVNYRGTLINGKEFDSSYKSGKPIEFPPESCHSGWTEGVQLMKEGANANSIFLRTWPMVLAGPAGSSVPTKP